MYYQKNMSTNNLSKNSDDISIIDLYKTLWENKIKILIISLIFTLIFFIYANSLKDMYESKALLASSTSSSSNSSLNRFSGVASLAGINLPSDSESNKLLIGLERLKSIDFFKMVMDKHDLYYEIMAVTSWDIETNSFSVNEDIYDIKNDKWTSDNRFSINGKPSIQQAHSVFMNNFSVNYLKIWDCLCSLFRAIDLYFAFIYCWVLVMSCIVLRLVWIFLRLFSHKIHQLIYE